MLSNFTILSKNMTVDLTIMNHDATRDFIYSNYKIFNGVPGIYKLFESLMSEAEMFSMFTTFKQFIDACTINNLTFFIYGGSLLGAYRHHGMVPWDDDIDVIMSVSQKELTRNVLSNVSGYSLFSPHKTQWKFYRQNLTSLTKKVFSWPYIDIFFYSENSTHIWDEIPSYARFVYRKDWVFPLVYRPFEGGMVPVPCNMKKAVENNYDTNKCATNFYYHKIEALSPKFRRNTINCKLLYEMFPFVFRSTTEGYITEHLKTNNVTLATVRLPNFC